MFRFMNEQQLYLKLQKEIEEAPVIPPCQTTDPDIWFGVNDNKTAFYKTAKKLCSMCPVQNTCAEYALTAHEPEGVWGGLTPEERRRMWQARERLVKRRTRNSHWLS